MKICLINPAWRFVTAADVILSQNLALGYLAGTLRARGGHDVRIIDALALGFNQHQPQSDGTLRVGLTDDQIVAALGSEVDLIGITVPFSHLADSAELLCAAIKAAHPRTPVIFGGVHPSTCPHEFAGSAADYWLVGEGEKALLALADGVEPGTIPGLLSRSKPHLPPGELAPQMENLDEIPPPARDLLPMDAYRRLSPRRIRHRPSASIITSRGCPWDCEFCSIHPMYGYRWRSRSAENVLAEVRELVERYGIRQLEFEDDNLTLHRDRAAEIFAGLCRLRQDQRLDLTWGTPNGIRAETVDRPLLLHMRQSGCVRVTFALEHGDEQVRRSMNKKLDLDKFESAVRAALEVGLHVEIFTLVGYPGEAAACFENARRYYRKLAGWGVHTLHFFYPQPYPGTKLYQRCRREGFLQNEKYSLLPLVKIQTPDFDTAEVVRRRDMLLGEFDRTYRFRRRIKSLLPAPLVSVLNRFVPRKAM